MFVNLLMTVMSTEAVKSSERIAGQLATVGLKLPSDEAIEKFGLDLQDIPEDFGKVIKVMKTDDVDIVFVSTSDAVTNVKVEVKAKDNASPMKSSLAEKMAADKAAIETGTAVSEETA